MKNYFQSITYDQYTARWSQPAYAVIVEWLAQLYKSDGCTGVPDFYRLGCLEHDIAYRSGCDPLGYRITREEADKRFRWYIESKSPFGVLSPMAWWRYFGVRLFGTKAWSGNKEENA